MGRHVVKQHYDDEGRLIIKPYLLKDLAAIFDVTRHTLKRWMSQYPKELEQKGQGKHYSIQQVEFMLLKFGTPSKVALPMPGKDNRRIA